MKPIGVFDSGGGGLTVVAALRRQLPHESFIYLGDTARLPYGTKSAATVTRYTRRNIAFLLDRGVKAIVVACNTASALALDSLDVDVPVWGVIEPGAAQAAHASRGRIGVVATQSTVGSGAYEAALLAHRPDLVVVSKACPLFVPLVEEGWYDDPVTTEIAQRYLEPLSDARIDTLVLGCTHYPLLAGVLQKVVGEDVTLVDSAESVALAVRQGLEERDLLAVQEIPEHHLCITDSAERFRELAVRILGSEAASLELVELPITD